MKKTVTALFYQFCVIYPDNRLNNLCVVPSASKHLAKVQSKHYERYEQQIDVKSMYMVSPIEE